MTLTEMSQIRSGFLIVHAVPQGSSEIQAANLQAGDAKPGQAGAEVLRTDPVS